MVIHDDYHEVMDLAEAMLAFVIHGLQERARFKELTTLTKRLHSSAGSFNIGSNGDGRFPRITFGDAKTLLREQCGIKTATDLDNFRCVTFLIFTGISVC